MPPNAAAYIAAWNVSASGDIHVHLDARADSYCRTTTHAHLDTRANTHGYPDADKPATDAHPYLDLDAHKAATDAYTNSDVDAHTCLHALL